MTEPLRCRRCGEVAHAEWIDITTAWDSTPKQMLGRSWCLTPGCVDWEGSPYVPAPDVPGELTYDDRQWLRRQGQVAVELAVLNRRLMEGM